MTCSGFAANPSKGMLVVPQQCLRYSELEINKVDPGLLLSFLDYHFAGKA